ncbi:hypothetical protein [Staphylococcus chromogenes]|nr:hypothetical protein [Staphylococcus chromogenes]
MKTTSIILILLLWINLFIGNSYTSTALTLATTFVIIKLYKKGD